MHRNFLEEAATIDECITSPYRGSGGCSDENNVLKLLQHPEGRVLPDGANWEYQYFLKDHLGNVRITFTAKTQTATNYTTDFEAATNANFQNYSNTTFDLVDHTDAAGTVYQKVQWLNGGVNGRVGLAKSLAVMPGDQVSITAYAKYMNMGTTANPNAFITSLAAAFGVSSGSTGEALKIYNGLNSYATTIPGGDHYQDNENAPKAFVTIIFFDKDYNLIDAAWDQVTTTGAQTSPTVKQPPHDVMSISAKAPEAGYAFVFVSNEHFNYVDVYFDDVTVGHTPSPIVSTSDYFPFGLSYNSMERAGSLEQKYMYNGKELQDEMALNWYDYGARMYMPEIGRWGVVDPLSEISRRWSPFAYGFNNPLRFTDPDGMNGEDQVKKDRGGREVSRTTWGTETGGGADIYYAGEDATAGSGGGGGGTSMGTFSSSTRQAINGSKFVKDASSAAAEQEQAEQTQEGLSFSTLWDDYGSDLSHTDEDGNEIFPDYCAINLSEALIKSGMSPGGTKCWGDCSSKQSHTIRAQELADWLEGNLSGVKVLTGANFQEYISGKTGIVFFQDYWQRKGETGVTGDHIDLWNENEMGSYGVIRTWVRTNWPAVGQGLGMSDLSKSTQVLFWEIK